MKAPTYTQSLRLNIMGGTNVITYRNGEVYHVESYANRSNAQRSVRTGAALRVAIKVEEG